MGKKLFIPFHTSAPTENNVSIGKRSRIDIITSISGIEFKDAWKNKRKGMYGNVSCNFISKDDLKKNKKAAGRSKDKADLELLEKI